ncbi:hypothetical protein CCR75_001653 [Bremia lactucae]|uniref:t-SNARE coiled-coil homology domain-containing protein n=1 Tax=Bremia lactucae TaxID=4779 RepID=A0A976IG07_BRELC|nr:hypothetical protein CCR75_001653 [Bremia lactucae]
MTEAQPTGDYVEAVTPRLLKRMDKATEDQERQLDAVYSGVKRLHNAAVATNDEVVSQNGMLDDVSIQIDNTESAVQQQTVAARKVVSAHRKLFCYYVIILLLAAALLIVILV